MSAPVDVLAMAAHPDDVEQTCAGTLIRMAEQGYRTGALDLTAGEMGTRGSGEERASEATAAAKEMLLAERHNLHLPDAKLENTLEARLAIAQKIRDLRPHVVVLPYWQARHPDHYRCSQLGYEACFLAGLRKADLEGEPHRPAKIVYASLYADVRPSFVVDISAQFERRLKALLCYHSQFETQAKGSDVFPASAQITQRVRAAARYYGMLIDVEYGEPYVVKEMLRVGDIARMGVRSM
jgi:bacillithiol biosynthesis deacetylase BshB1